MSLTHPSLAENDLGARQTADIPISTLREGEWTIRTQLESAHENPQAPHPEQSKTPATEESHHVAFVAAPPTDPSAQFADTGSTYYSVRSRISFRSIFTRSTGKRSQNGATWLGALTKTMNSGFGNTRVVEGRERGGYLPSETGVGRTGKPPAPVPHSMLKALGVKMDEADIPVKSLPIYGLTLEALHQRDGVLVPSLVQQITELVERHGSNTKNVYSGIPSDIYIENEVFEGLQNNDLSALQKLDFTNPKGFTIEYVAELLINFFTQLPDPLLTAAFFPAFLKAVDTKDKAKRTEHLHAVIVNLPDANYFTLKALMEHLNRLVKKSKVNNIEDMSGHWAHALMWGARQKSRYGPKTELQCRVVSTILENCERIFSEESVNKYGRGRQYPLPAW